MHSQIVNIGFDRKKQMFSWVFFLNSKYANKILEDSLALKKTTVRYCFNVCLFRIWKEASFPPDADFEAKATRREQKFFSAPEADIFEETIKF